MILTISPLCALCRCLLCTPLSNQLPCVQVSFYILTDYLPCAQVSPVYTLTDHLPCVQVSPVYTPE